MSEDPDPVKASRKSEAKIKTLGKEIETLKQRLRLLQSEETSEIETKEEIMKQNHEKIQELQEQIDKLNLQLQKGKLADEKVLKKAFQKYPNEMGIVKGKTAAQVIEIMEGRVFDMAKKRDALRYEIRKKENDLICMKEELENIEKRCGSKDEEMDKDITDKAREVENDYQEAKMRVLEMQQIERIYREIQQKLATDLLTMPTRLDELEKTYRDQQQEIETLLERESKACESRDKAKEKYLEVEIAALHARQEKEKVLAEFSQMEQRPMHFSSSVLEEQGRRNTESRRAEEELNNLKKRQEEQLEQYRKVFEQIKVATGVTDIEDAEMRFASQKAIKENLIDLKARLENTLQNLKMEKTRLESQKQTMLGADLACPEKTLEEELVKWKGIHEEQRQKKENAENECKRVSNTIARVKMSLWHILQLMDHHLQGIEIISSETMPDVTLPELANKIKERMNEVMKRLKGQDIDSLLEKLKKEQPYLKKLDDDKIAELVRRKLAKPPSIEEESSSEEEEEARKRIDAKKDAKSFADIKQKQKGRGRGLKL